MSRRFGARVAAKHLWVYYGRRVSMRFEECSFGSIRINGVTYEHDVVIDRGEVRKRKKKPSKKFRAGLWTHAIVNGRGDPLEVQAARDRHRNRSIAGHGRGEARSKTPKNQAGRRADSGCN